MTDMPGTTPDTPQAVAPNTVAPDEVLRARAESKLRAAMNYWLATTRPDGLPHAAPVWGVWVDGAFWFGTMGQKSRNLAATPHAVLHLDSADDVVMVAGPVDCVPLAEMPEAVARAYGDKYVIDGERYDLIASLATLGESASMYRLRPRDGWAWLEGAFEHANARWRYP